MSNGVFILLATAIVGSSTAPVAVPAAGIRKVCPDETNTSRGRVLSLLSPWLMDIRRRFGFEAAREDHLRPLGDPQDADVCRRLRSVIRHASKVDPVHGNPWLMTFYEADGFYFVAVSRDQQGARPDGPQVLGRGGWLLVYDSNLDLLLKASG